jgi:hypothetical protein
MSAEANEVATGNGAAEPAKKKTEVEVVKMEDGRQVEFAGKRKLVKDYLLDEKGNLDHITLDFRNGVTRKITIPQSLLGQFAGHGALQKYGDELAGLKNPDGTEADIDDMVLTIDELDKNIQAGKWSTRVPGDGMGGTSILIKALMAYSGKTLEVIKNFLEGKDAKFKAALRADDKKVSKLNNLTMAGTVKALEAEKVAKGVKVDTAAALGDLDAMGDAA